MKGNNLLCDRCDYYGREYCEAEHQQLVTYCTSYECRRSILRATSFTVVVIVVIDNPVD